MIQCRFALTVSQTQPGHASPDEGSSVNERSDEDPSMLNKARSAVKGIASGLRTVLNVTKEVSDAFPPLKGVVSGLLAIWDVYEVWICDSLMNQGTLLCSMQSHSSNEDTRKKLKKHIESLESIVEAIDSRKDKKLPDLKKVLERFTMYAP